MSELIAVDWGTSSFRAYLFDAQGNIRQSMSAAAGIRNVTEKSFEEELEKQLKNFGEYDPKTSIIASGMITSRQGWLETPYVNCPVSFQDLADNLTPLKTTRLGTIWFVPGIKQLLPTPDIMRGEESQLAGIQYCGSQIVLLPGTHCKWVQLEEGAIREFRTFMTGDIYHAVTERTILQFLPKDAWSKDRFLDGVGDGHNLQKDGRSLLSTLFQVRVGTILGLQPEEGGRSYISGMLIGCEIAEATGSGLSLQSAAPLLVVGSDTLSKLYIEALAHLGYSAQSAPDKLAAKGLFNLAQAQNLI